MLNTLLVKPVEVHFRGSLDLAAIRVKIQRLSDELADALVSLERLNLMHTAILPEEFASKLDMGIESSA